MRPSCGSAPLGDVHAGHDLDARDDGRVHARAAASMHLVQHAVDAEAHARAFSRGLDVDVAGPVAMALAMIKFTNLTIGESPAACSTSSRSSLMSSMTLISSLDAPSTISSTSKPSLAVLLCDRPRVISSGWATTSFSLRPVRRRSASRVKTSVGSATATTSSPWMRYSGSTPWLRAQSLSSSVESEGSPRPGSRRMNFRPFWCARALSRVSSSAMPRRTRRSSRRSCGESGGALSPRSSSSSETRPPRRSVSASVRCSRPTIGIRPPLAPHARSGRRHPGGS